jgi:RNA polymerase sigma factor (sigma-70 family)
VNVQAVVAAPAADLGPVTIRAAHPTGVLLHRPDVLGDDGAALVSRRAARGQAGLRLRGRESVTAHGALLGFSNSDQPHLPRADQLPGAYRSVCPDCVEVTGTPRPAGHPQLRVGVLSHPALFWASLRCFFHQVPDQARDNDTTLGCQSARRNRGCLVAGTCRNQRSRLATRTDRIARIDTVTSARSTSRTQLGRHPLGEAVGGPSDAELLRLAAEGNADSANLLCRRLLPVVERTLLRVLGKREQDHDDLVQLSFEQLVRTFAQERFAGHCSLTTWACTIAARVGLAELRKRHRQRRVLVESSPDAEHGRELSRAWERRSAAYDEVDLVRRALASINAKRAWVLYLHDVEGRKLTEVAALMSVSVSSAQSRLVRGRRQFMDAYAKLRASADDGWRFSRQEAR